jgi:hypothetical protein
MVRNADMKQTKPYGRAFSASDNNSAKRPDKPLDPGPYQHTEAPQSADTDRGALVFNTPNATIQAPRQRFTAASVSINTMLLVAAILAGITLRDSVFIQNLITMVTNKESVMTCLSGQMQYEDWSVWDRLVGNGRFVCTEWKVQSRFVSFPRF